jgi:hypothetical protein
VAVVAMQAGLKRLCLLLRDGLLELVIRFPLLQEEAQRQVGLPYMAFLLLVVAKAVEEVVAVVAVAHGVE